MARLSDRFPNTRIDIVGRGADRARVEQAIRDAQSARVGGWTLSLDLKWLTSLDVTMADMLATWAKGHSGYRSLRLDGV